MITSAVRMAGSLLLLLMFMFMASTAAASLIPIRHHHQSQYNFGGSTTTTTTTVAMGHHNSFPPSSFLFQQLQASISRFDFHNNWNLPEEDDDEVEQNGGGGKNCNIRNFNEEDGNNDDDDDDDDDNDEYLVDTVNYSQRCLFDYTQVAGEGKGGRAMNEEPIIYNTPPTITSPTLMLMSDKDSASVAVATPQDDALSLSWSGEAVARQCCHWLQWVDDPTPGHGLERSFEHFTWDCRKCVTARQGADSVDRFCQYGALSPALQPFFGAARIALGPGTLTPSPAATFAVRGALLSFPVQIDGAPILSVCYASGLDRPGVGQPPRTHMVLRLEQQRRPPHQGRWLIKEVLNVQHAFAGDMGNADVGG